MPYEKKILKYCHRQKSSKVIYFIYADFERILRKTNDVITFPEHQKQRIELVILWACFPFLLNIFKILIEERVIWVSFVISWVRCERK